MDTCNFRKCLNQKNGLCTATEKDIVNGRCQSIAWVADCMKANAPPIERRSGNLMRPNRSWLK
jgi:hypothetical protein